MVEFFQDHLLLAFNVKHSECIWSFISPDTSQGVAKLAIIEYSAGDKYLGEVEGSKIPIPLSLIQPPPHSAVHVSMISAVSVYIFV